MLYLVGGCSRSGKSTLAGRMRERHGAAWLALDALKMGLFLGAPELGVDPNHEDMETADRMWPIVKAMAENALFDGRDYVIEGVNMRPDSVAAFMAENPGAVATCFLGYPGLSAKAKAVHVARDSGRPNDWLNPKGEAYVLNYLQGCVAWSTARRDDCERLGLAFFDTGADFEAGLAAAERHLVGG
jgi:hypothetical protein